jgi:hypothetical protein
MCKLGFEYYIELTDEKYKKEKEKKKGNETHRQLISRGNLPSDLKPVC